MTLQILIGIVILLQVFVLIAIYDNRNQNRLSYQRVMAALVEVQKTAIERQEYALERVLDIQDIIEDLRDRAQEGARHKHGENDG